MDNRGALERGYLVSVFLLFAVIFQASASLAGDVAPPVQAGQVCVRVPGPFLSLCNVLPKVYAQVVDAPVPVYGRVRELPLPAPKRWLKEGFVWVSLESTSVVEGAGRQWLMINPGEFVERRHLRLDAPSVFRGVELDGLDTPFLWVLLNTTPSRTPGGPMDYKAVDLPRYSLFEILDVKRVNGWNWYKVGEKMWIEQRRAAVIFQEERPEKIGEHEKWICVDLYEQTLTAYEGDRMVYATLISSGVKQFPTVEGLFRIWQKVEMAKMSGSDGKSDYYYLEDIPWQMYFYQGYAIHTSYWHDWFGFPQSHGCVNVAPYDAWWLFNWSDPQPVPGRNRVFPSKGRPGTWVYVHP